MDSSFLVPLGFFAAVVAIILVPRYFRNKERESLQETLRIAFQNGQPMPPELVESITRDQRAAPSPARDLRVGIVWLCVGIGLALFAYSVGHMESDAYFPLLGIAAIPGMIGVAFIALGALGIGKKSA